MKLEDIINSEYLESDLPENLIDENQNIKDIVKYILDELEEKAVLKNKFNRKDFINEMYEDYNLLDKVREVSDDILVHIRESYGNLEVIDNRSNSEISDIWKFTTTQALNLDKENGG